MLRRWCWGIWGLVVVSLNKPGLWQEQPGTDCYHMITYTSRKVCRLNDLPNHVRPSFARCLSMSLEGRRGAGVGVTAGLPMDVAADG